MKKAKRIGFYFVLDVYWSAEISIKSYLKIHLESLFQLEFSKQKKKEVEFKKNKRGNSVKNLYIIENDKNI